MSIREELEGRLFRTADLKGCGFGRIGENVVIHSRANIFGLENIYIGDNVQIGAFVNITARARLVLGDYVHVGSYSQLSAMDEIRFDDFSCVSHDVKVYTESDDFSGRSMTNPTVPQKYVKSIKGPVVFGRHALVGAGSIVMPGVELGEGVAVGALSLVTRSLEPWGVYGGVPARLLKPRRRDILDFEREFLSSKAD